MKNFTFKVFPVPSGLENKQEEQGAMNSIEQPGVPKADALEPETAKKPCPSPSPLPPKMPCPPMTPIPVPPQMPCPPMGPMPMPPQMPCPPEGYGMSPCPMPPMAPGCPQYPMYSAPPFTCPYFRLAHSYVPWQYYNIVFSPEEALHKGTLFPELCMPQGKYGPCEGPRPCKVYFGGGAPYGCE
ncbi:MAG: spore coat associated protein CotJA [Peptococcia bacterium]